MFSVFYFASCSCCTDKKTKPTWLFPKYVRSFMFSLLKGKNFQGMSVPHLRNISEMSTNTIPVTSKG